MSEQTDIEALKQTLITVSDWRKRIEALRELDTIGGDEVKDAIADALLDENPHVGEYAAGVLERFGSKAVPQLISALEHADERVLPSILYTLEKIGDISVLPAIEELIKHPYPRASGFAICAFCKLAPREQAVPYLLRGLQSEMTGLQNRCAKLIAPLYVEEAVPHLLRIVLDSGCHVRTDAGRSAAIALGQLGDTGLDALLGVSQHMDAHVRRNAVTGLGESTDPRAFDRLAELLHDENRLVLAKAIEGLAKLNHPGTYDLLLPLLGGSRASRSLIPALGKTGDLRTVPVLMERLRKGKDCAIGLKILGDRHWGIDPLECDMSHIPEVIAAARNDPDKSIRILAIWMLSSLGGEYERLRTSWLRTHETIEGLDVPEIYLEARDLVAELLHDEDADIRFSAIHVVSGLADRHVLLDIMKRLLDKDYLVAREAIRLITRLARSEHVDISFMAPTLIRVVEKRKHHFRGGAMYALATIADDASIKTLMRLISDEDDPHRKTIVHALSSGPPDRVIPALLNLFDKDMSPDLRAAVVFALSLCQHRLGANDKRVLETMTHVLNNVGSDPSATFRARDRAASALLLMKDESAIPALMHAIDYAPEWQIRMSAVDALRCIGDHQSAARRLYPLLRHADSLVRTAATQSLGYVGDTSEDELLRAEIVEKLIPQLDDEGKGYVLRPTVASAAAKSLYSIGTTRALDALKKRMGHKGKRGT